MKLRINPFLCSAISLLFVVSSHAASFSWDGTSTGTGAQGGVGTWDSNTTANWWNGTTNVVWPASGTDNDAVFGATAGAVAVSGTVTVNDMSIATGYTIGADNTIGKIILNGTTPTITTTGSGGTANIGAIIDGSAGLTTTGPVTVQLRGANIYTGDTRVLNGTLLIGLGNNRLPTGTTLILGDSVANTSGVFQMNSRSQQVAGLQSVGSGTGNRVINGNVTASTFTVSNTTDQTFGGILGGTGSNHNNFLLTKSGAANLVLTNTNTYTGATSVSVGTLTLAKNNTLSQYTNVSISAAATLALRTGDGTTGWSEAQIDTLRGTSGFSLAAGSFLGFDTSTNGDFTYSTSISGSPTYGLSKLGAGTLTISGTNTYTGTTAIKNGSLALTGGNDRLLTTGSVVLGDVSTAGKLILGDATTARDQTLAGLTVTGTGGSVVGAAVANSVLTLNNASGTNTFAGKLGGTGLNENKLALTKDGAGTLALSGDNSFTGDVTVSAGRLAISHSNALGTGTKNFFMQGGSRVFEISNNITLGSNITLNASTNSGDGLGIVSSSGTNEIQGQINITTGNGVLNVSSTAGTLTLSGNVTATTTGRALILGGASANANTVSGIISNGGTPNMPVTKQGAGKWVLSKANTYSGDTTITGGTLALSGSGSIANSANIAVASGATFDVSTVTSGNWSLGSTQKLTGSGGLTGATTISGTHNAGDAATNAGVGSQAFSSSLSYANGSIFEWDLNASSTSSGFDTVSAVGAIGVGTTSTVFKVLFGATALADVQNSGNTFWNTPFVTRVWNMSDVFGKAFTSGAFQSVATSSDVSTYGSFTITSSTLTWTAVPEPTSALAGLLITAGLLRRRRA